MYTPALAKRIHITAPAQPEVQIAGPVKKPANYAREIRLTQAFLLLTLAAWLGVSWETGNILWQRIQSHQAGAIIEQLAFIAITQSLIYGNFVYQLTRIGYLRRRLRHKPATEAERETLYREGAPALTVLVPSYKEELAVIRRTLLSAALQDYPNRRIVLLVDNPPFPKSLPDQFALEQTRSLPAELQSLLNRAAQPFLRAQSEFELRRRAALRMSAEAAQLASLYLQAAALIRTIAVLEPCNDADDALLHERVFGRLIATHTARASQLNALAAQGELTLDRVAREYARLAALFTAEITSFERKRYVNLSHESNKAMNLNSYIGLIGKSWAEVEKEDGLHLVESGHAAFSVPASGFVLTLDADSLLVPEYAIVMVHEMRRPGNERLAVAQTPYNTVPGPANPLERIAGATTDIQYLIHQGFTHFGATYWVGANAMLRMEALQDIRHSVKERGFDMPVFIQDRTVIEDTESSVDLVVRGWRLFNYPERLAFSATPRDFGSLLIQRRRWANGGLIILPKLLRYLASPGRRMARLREGFFRVHYLASIALVNLGLLILLGHSFEESTSSLWLPLTAIPYFVLYGRDLRYSGYRLRDFVSVYALNLLLIPVNTGGVLKSIQQAATGKRIPFGRTPKVSDRTAVPALYIAAEYGLLLWWLVGLGRDISAQRWASAAFCLFNAALLAFAIVRFIGIRESLQDLRPAAQQPAPPQSQGQPQILPLPAAC